MSRPEKYQNLGGMPNKMRVPDTLMDEFEEILSELDRLSVDYDAQDLLSKFADSLSDIELNKKED